MGATRDTVYVGKETDTPLGPVWVALSDDGLVAIEISDEPEKLFKLLPKFGFRQVVSDPVKTRPVLKQIRAYLLGKRKDFEIPIDWSVLTPFQEQALKVTRTIPFGHVSSYGEIASQLGNPRNARAVGGAEANNPMPLVIPCHRVLGADGGLHGYGAGKGLETKAWLLDLEGVER